MYIDLTQNDDEEVKEKEVYPPFEDRNLMDFKWIDDEIVYVSLNSFSKY